MKKMVHISMTTFTVSSATKLSGKNPTATQFDRDGVE